MSADGGVLERGIRAGRIWSAAHDAQARNLCSWLEDHEALGAWDYRSVYASTLTNRAATEDTGGVGDDLLIIARDRSIAEALLFWQSQAGWPQDWGEQETFVEGFVRGAAGAESVSVPPDSDFTRWKT